MTNMPRKNKLSPEDIELFRRKVGPVNPMRATNRATLVKKRRPPPRQPSLDQDQADREPAFDTFEPMDAAADEELSFFRPGVQHAQFRKLRKGRCAIRSELDLHGLTAAQARQELIAFLRESQSRGERCVRIIHGKGYNSPDRRSVLKTMLNIWLRQCDEVLAFCSAPLHDGGTGAAYVLLSTR